LLRRSLRSPRRFWVRRSMNAKGSYRQCKDA
jgi:hypothetical protein